MIDRLRGIFSVTSVIVINLTHSFGVLYRMCGILLVLLAPIICSGCHCKHDRCNHVRVAEEFVAQVTRTDKPNKNATSASSLLISNLKTNNNIAHEEYSVNSLVAFLSYLNRQNVITSRAKQPFEFQFIRDSITTDRSMAWVWFQNKYASTDRYWVITLISINDEWYVDIPICD